jgi:hypothetical protein
LRPYPTWLKINLRVGSDVLVVIQVTACHPFDSARTAMNFCCKFTAPPSEEK